MINPLSLSLHSILWVLEFCRNKTEYRRGYEKKSHQSCCTAQWIRNQTPEIHKSKIRGSRVSQGQKGYNWKTLSIFYAWLERDGFAINDAFVWEEGLTKSLELEEQDWRSWGLSHKNGFDRETRKFYRKQEMLSTTDVSKIWTQVVFLTHKLKARKLGNAFWK